MAFRSFTLTLNSNVQALSTGLAAGEPDDPIAMLYLQAGTANAGQVAVGDSAITATDYGIRIPVPVDSIPAAPFPLGPFVAGSTYLKDIFVKGSNNEELHVLVITR